MRGIYSNHFPLNRFANTYTCVTTIPTYVAHLYWPIGQNSHTINPGSLTAEINCSWRKSPANSWTPVSRCDERGHARTTTCSREAQMGSFNCLPKGNVAWGNSSSACTEIYRWPYIHTYMTTRMSDSFVRSSCNREFAYKIMILQSA
jgi:hypothetical protein